MNATSITLDPETIAALGAHITVAPGPLYPFAVGGASASSTATPEPDLAAALLAMATATAASSIHLAGGGFTLEYGVWFGADGDAVGMKATGETIVVEVPPHGDYVATLAAEVLGGSSLRGVELDATLSPLAAVVLAVAFDEARRDAQLALAMERPLAIRGIAPTDVLALLDAAVARGTGLCGFVGAAQAAPVASPSADAVLSALNELVGSGLFTREGDRVMPDAAVHALATRCFGISAGFALSRAWITDTGTIERAALHAAQFGVHDIVVVEHVGTTTRVATESAAGLIEIIEAFLTNAVSTPLP